MDAAQRAGRRRPEALFGAVSNPVRMMMREHDSVGQLLRELRAVTHDYALPAKACGSFEALFEGLKALERDLFEHIHLESNILFPRALAMEAEG